MSDHKMRAAYHALQLGRCFIETERRRAALRRARNWHEDPIRRLAIEVRDHQVFAPLSRVLDALQSHFIAEALS